MKTCECRNFVTCVEISSLNRRLFVTFVKRKLTLLKFTQHIPGFVDGVKPKTIEFSTTEELLRHPFFRRIAEQPGFSHFAFDEPYILEISEDGFKWWVLGSVNALVTLPKWDGGRYRVRLDGAETVLIGAEIYSTCGDEVILRDGRKCERVHRS